MNWRKRRQREERRQRMLDELLELRRTSDPEYRGLINDMILYVEIGRNRMRLPDNFVDGIRAFVRPFDKAPG